MSTIKRDFSTVTWVLIPVAIAINIAVGQLVITFGLPIYLDSIGTILVGVLAGPWAGGLTGLLSNLIWGLSGINPGYTPYAPVAAIIGICAGLFGSIGWMRNTWRVVLAGLITGVVAAIASAPITAYLYGGVTGTGTDVIVAYLRSAGASIFQAALGQGIVSDPIDKLVSFLIVFLLVIDLPERFLGRFPRADNLREGA